MAIFTTRPVIMGTNGVVTAGHYLAAAAGFRILERGGNAIDAGVAAGFVESVVEPRSNGIGGEVPILLYSAAEGRPFAINGQGCAPKAATIEWFKANKIDIIPPDGFLPATVPAAFGSWATALMRFGTMRLKDVLEPAIEMSEEGFAMFPKFREEMEWMAPRFIEEWPTTEKIYLPNGRIPEVGEKIKNTDWANTFKKVVDAETKASAAGRAKAIREAIDFYYKGEIAEKIVEFSGKTPVKDVSGEPHTGLLTMDDFCSYRTKVEEPVSTNYRNYQVYKCNTWSQGPVFLQQLNLLEGYDLAHTGHSSPQHIHTVIEASKLAFADREKYYGDPDFVSVPLDMLLSKDYAEERRNLIDPRKASVELRPGDAPPTVPIASVESDLSTSVHINDTTHLDVIDKEGNMMAATPSGGWIPSSPVVQGLGFPLGTRAQIFYLDSKHANALVPRKRPRTTLTPSLVLKDKKPFIVFGTPGGDKQDQWTLQFFLNFVDFGMNLQEAIDAPNFHSDHFPSSFYPHDAHPGHMTVEGRIGEDICSALSDMGHIVKVSDHWENGLVMAVKLDNDSGVISGVASPRHQMAYAMGR